MSLLDNLRYFR